MKCCFAPVGAIIAVILCCTTAAAAAPTMNLVFSCRPDNDLYQVLSAGGAKHSRCDSAAEAVKLAADGAGVLILADGYPQKTTPLEPAALAEAAEKNLRLYVEYPAALPNAKIGPPKDTDRERGVVVSEIFGESLPPLRIVGINGCRYLPLAAEKPHLVLAKVAGVDRAVFGLTNTPVEPLLFDHPRGNLLVATTKLSQFVTGRYMPQAAWAAIWRTILCRLQPDAPPPALDWTPTVRPSFGRDEPLPPAVELQSLRRAADWIVTSRVLRHPQWPTRALDRALSYNEVHTMPATDWPRGDGSLGVVEGFSSKIDAHGGQAMRYAVRCDCNCETAMLMAFDAAGNNRPQNGRIAANLLEFTFLKSGLAGGHSADPASPSYGHWGWDVATYPRGGDLFGDDNARSMLSVLAAAAVQKDSRWDDFVARCVLANFRTTGIYGFRQPSVVERRLHKEGWRRYWDDKYIQYSPHFETWLWACFLWAYEKTRFEPFLARTETGAKMLMAAYPAKWDWCNRSGSIERARALLPLAWLVRVKDTPEHRRWLRTVAGDLTALQDSSGAICEVLGDGGVGTSSNAAYGTHETSIIQTNGDPECDMLYTCNFALIGLHEAAAATGDPFYAAAEDKLAKFLCRIQLRSQRHPEFDGAWCRAFNFRNWDYWASNGDSEWGAWCMETGWTPPWIAGTLALRHLKTSLWDLTQRAAIAKDFDRLRRQMLPDEALRH